MTPEFKQIQTVEQFDFVTEFKSKLNSTTPIPEKDAAFEATYFESIGIEKLKRSIPALLLSVDNKKLELWIDNPNNLDLRFPHSHLEDKLKEKIYLDHDRIRTQSALLLEDYEGNKYLSVKYWIGKMIKQNVEEGTEGIGVPEHDIESWEDLINRYGFHKIISPFQVIEKEQKGEIHYWQEKAVLSTDLLGSYREARFLRSFRVKYEMTAAQFLRFRTMVNSAKHAQQAVNYDEFAKDIVSD